MNFFKRLFSAPNLQAKNQQEFEDRWLQTRKESMELRRMMEQEKDLNLVDFVLDSMGEGHFQYGDFAKDFWVKCVNKYNAGVKI